MSSLKPNLIRDNLGNIYYRKMINGRRVIIPSYTKNHKHANKLHTTLEYQALMEHYAPKDKKKFKRFSELVKIYLNDKEYVSLEDTIVEEHSEFNTWHYKDKNNLRLSDTIDGVKDTHLSSIGHEVVAKSILRKIK